MPPLAADFRDPRKRFDAVDLGSDGVLRVAHYVAAKGEIHESSIVYRLGWDSDQFEQDVVLPKQTVVQLASGSLAPSQTYPVYALSRLGPPRDYGDSTDKGIRVGAISSWPSHRQPTVSQLHTFEERFRLSSLDVGKRGVLLVYATDGTLKGAPHDYTIYSTDNGRSWKDTDDGISQGGWFDRDTNTQYALYGYTLKKRSF